MPGKFARFNDFGEVARGCTDMGGNAHAFVAPLQSAVPEASTFVQAAVTAVIGLAYYARRRTRTEPNISLRLSESGCFERFDGAGRGCLVRRHRALQRKLSYKKDVLFN
jgi:hypothetical protein